MQSKKQSMKETLISVAIGYVVAVLSQVVIFPMFDIHKPIGENMLIAGWFTVVSIIRGYFVRRYFNRKHDKDSGHFRLRADIVEKRAKQHLEGVS